MAGSLAAAPTETTAPRYRRLRYTVRKGQTLAAIAERFEVSPGQLRRWNELSKHATVRPGQQLVVLQLQPAAPVPEQANLAATSAIAAMPRPAIAVDSAAQALAAANLRYAREAQEASRREAAQAQELLRRQRQQALRAVAQQRADAFRLAAAAKVAATAEKARRLALAATAPAESQNQAAESVAALLPDSSVQLPRRRNLVAASLAPADDNAPAHPRGLPPTAEREVPVAAGLAGKAGLTAAAATKTVGPHEVRPAFYTVQPGDNLTKVAHETGATIAQLREWNQLPAEGGLQSGQRLRLREGGAVADHTRTFSQAASRQPVRLNTHTVQPGDTLFNISQRFGVSVQELRRLNHLKSDAVKLGQKLLVQAG